MQKERADRQDKRIEGLEQQFQAFAIGVQAKNNVHSSDLADYAEASRNAAMDDASVFDQ